MRAGDAILAGALGCAALGFVLGIPVGAALTLGGERELARERDEARAELAALRPAADACGEASASAEALMARLLGPDFGTGGPWRPFVVTAYCRDASTRLTYTETEPHEALTVAVDPAFVPLGSTLLVRGVGVVVARDTGRLVKGAHLDLFLEGCDRAATFGRRVALARVLGRR